MKLQIQKSTLKIRSLLSDSHSVALAKLGYLRSGGFTLIELMIALALFTVIAFISIGAILSIFDANRRSQASKTIVDNLNYSIESMARTVRFGTNYHCGASGVLSAPQNCNTGASSDTLLAVTFNGSVNVFRLNGTALQKSTNGGATYTNITPPEVVIQYLRFYVLGSTFGDVNQPYVLAVIKGYAGNKPTAQSNFTIQTMMSQRSLDI